jgi:hypothetical protein
LRARIVSSAARAVAALALVLVASVSAKTADAQYCGFYYSCTGNSGLYGAYPYSYYSTGYYGYPSNLYYGYPYYYGTPYAGYSFDMFGFSYPYFGYPLYTSSPTYYSFYGTPMRGYYGYGWSSTYGLPTASMVYGPGIFYLGNGKEYCFPC